jgi:hypothetical protein
MSAVKQYVDTVGVPQKKFTEDFQFVANMSLDEVAKLTQQECFDLAYTLYDYAGYLQLEISKQKNALSWCNNAISSVVAIHDGEFDKYTKHEMKIHLLAKENSFVQSVLQFKDTAESRLEMLVGQDFVVKKKADCLMRKGDRQ